MRTHPALRKTTLLGSIGALVALLVALLATAGPAPEHATAQAAGQARPNIIVIQTDDATLSEFYSTYVASDGITRRTMPRLLDEIRKGGITFSRYYASYPLCCPSRATLLSGRYSHNNGVLGNRAPGGGWYSFRRHTIYGHNLAVWLQNAGYRTYHYGKFLNEYGGGNDNPYAEATVPPG
jgi:arylsulfatase A-like enzyme